MPALYCFFALLLLLQLYTLWHIWRGEFPGRWEKRRLVNTVMFVPLLGLWQYWSHSVHRRREHNGFVV
jgi:hypothetical protein